MAAQKFSPEIPWVLVERGDDYFIARCTVCHGQEFVPPAGDVTGEIHRFAYAHREHSLGPGYLGLGDAVARVAHPIARAFGKAPCSPCEERRLRLNQLRMRLPW